MSNLLRHLRGLLIAIVALTMSAGLASAAHPAADRSSQVVTNAETTESSTETDESTSETETDTASETESDSSESASDNCTTDPTTLTPDQLAAMSHGSIVCWAAQQATPDGWDNHGAWVSHWAHMNKGADASSNGKSKGNSGKQ